MLAPAPPSGLGGPEESSLLLQPAALRARAVATPNTEILNNRMPALRRGSAPRSPEGRMKWEMCAAPAHSPSLGAPTSSIFPSSRLLTQRLFFASTTTAPTPSSDSTSSRPFLGPRMKTASSISSATSAVGAQMVTLRDAVAGEPVRGSMMWW